ncbi:lysozyme [Tautonia marina]|uniref:lysozyme n=1 Tax=Tautonia marina TaxID=2653855 RepID=UPI001260DD58|nr:lysozyme [Tautonia marina]
MKVSDRGIALIKDHEGLRLEAYLCPGNVWTIGYGSTKGVKQGMKVTKKQAEEMLRRDIGRFERAVNKLVTMELSQEQFDALVSLAFNIGEGAFAKSKLLEVLNAGKYRDAAAQFPKWRKSAGKVLPGLVKRRAAEKALFLEGTAPEPLKPLTKSRELIGSTVAAVGTAGDVALSEAKDAIEPVIGYSETLRWLFIALVFVGLGLTIYGRLSNRRKGIV